MNYKFKMRFFSRRLEPKTWVYIMYPIHYTWQNMVFFPCNETSIKAPKDWVGRASGLVNMWKFRKHGVSLPFPHTLPWASLPSGCSCVVSLYHKPVI